MLRNLIRRGGIVLAAWLPFFVMWLAVALSASREPFRIVLLASLISMGTAGLVGIPIWYACKRWPLPSQFSFRFYLLHVCLAVLYGIAWTSLSCGLQLLRGSLLAKQITVAAFGRQVFLGGWFYAILAGISYAVQTRNRLHEKEILAARAEALASAARLDALRARLNPHFLFNALHTLSALAKFRPETAEKAIERIGDMLRYTLKEDGRHLVEFSEEYGFTREYLAFEQLRYEDRLKVHEEIDPESFNFDVLPFSIQTLAENSVHHAISVRPEGGSIWIRSSAQDSRLTITVRDDGPGMGSDSSSHQFGLRSLRERLAAAYSGSAELKTKSSPGGFEATLIIPAVADAAEDVPKGAAAGP